MCKPGQSPLRLSAFVEISFLRALWCIPFLWIDCCHSIWQRFLKSCGKSNHLLFLEGTHERQ